MKYSSRGLPEKGFSSDAIALPEKGFSSDSIALPEKDLTSGSMEKDLVKTRLNRFISGFTLRVIPFLGYLLLRFLVATMRFTFVNFEGVRGRVARGSNIFFAFWHGRLMMMSWAYPGRGITTLISQHRDGELVARAVEYFGFECVRGSTTRGWMGGIKGLLRAVRRGRDLALTPDGPRGPRFKAQVGIVKIASRTGLPIVPVSFGASRKKTFKSWDAFLMPYPFSRGVFICGEPIEVGRSADEDEIERKRKEVEASLNDLTARADAFFCR